LLPAPSLLDGQSALNDIVGKMPIGGWDRAFFRAGALARQPAGGQDFGGHEPAGQTRQLTGHGWEFVERRGV